MFPRISAVSGKRSMNFHGGPSRRKVEESKGGSLVGRKEAKEVMVVVVVVGCTRRGEYSVEKSRSAILVGGEKGNAGEGV